MIEERPTRLFARGQEALLYAEVMRDANLALTQDLSLERVLETLLDYLRKLVPYDSASVMLVEGDARFVVTALRGYESFLQDVGLTKSISFDANTNALFGWIWSTKESLLIPDTKKDSGGRRLPGGEHTRNWIGVPLIAHDKVIGLYSLDKAQPDYFTQEHVRKAELLAAQATTAIQNARLFQQGEKYARQLEQRIAERERAEGVLRESTEYLRQIIDCVADPIFVKDQDHRFVLVNKALCNLRGLSRDDIIGKTDSEFFPKEQVDIFLEQDNLVLKTGVESPDEEITNAKGHIRTIVTKKTLLSDRGNKYVVGVIRDVTEQKEARIAAFATLARKLSGTTTPLEAAAIIGETAYILFAWDSCALDLYDADRDLIYPILNIDTIDGRQVEVTPSTSGRPPTPRASQVIRHGACLTLREEPSRFDEFGVPFGDKARPSTAIMTVPVTHASKVIGIFSIQSDTPHAYDNDSLNDFQSLADHCGEALNRIRAEQELRESEERYRELFENARDAIYVHDLSGRYTSINRAAEKLTGYSREEILGKRFADFVTPEDLPQVQSNFWKKLADHGQTAYEVEVIAKGGRRVPVELSSCLIFENGVAVGIHTARDITERKRAEEELRNYSRRLIEAQEAERKRIARELHDEIGQSLTACLINQRTLEHLCQQTPALPYIKENTGIIEEVLRQTQDLSFELRPSLLDDLGLASAIRWYLNRFGLRTGIVTQVVIDSLIFDARLSRELETNCFRIAQEALTNVARHAAAKHARLELQRLNGELVLLVKDDGKGMDLAALRKENPRATLGLRGMEERALAVGGKIEIHSIPSKGTEIRATFPIPSNKEE